MLPDDFVADVEALRSDGHDVEAHEEGGMANALIHGYSVPAGFSKPTTELLIRAPMSYRNGKPDMFWTDTDLVLANGGTPQNADQIETHLERQWRRFSWHPSNWNPGSDDLRTYLEFINTRLRKQQ